MGAPRIDQPAEVVYTTKLPRAVAARLRESARENDRSISGELRRIVREWAERSAGADDARA